MNTWTTAFRSLKRSPGFVAVMLLTLCLGIALNTCAFGIVNSLWFAPPPFRDPGSLVIVRQTHAKRGASQMAAFADLVLWKTHTRTLESVEGIEERAFNAGAGRLVRGVSPERLRGAAVTAGFIRDMGFRPLAGRGLTAADFRPDAPRVAMIGERYWRDRLGGRDVLGGEIVLDGRKTTIVGILPYGFRLLFGGYKAVIPLVEETPGQLRKIEVTARLRPGVTLAEAQAEMSAITRGQASGGEEWSARVLPLDAVWMVEAHRLYPILLVAAMLVLMVVCANVSNIALARGASRQREIAIRAALGAGRWRIARGLAAEGMILAMMGGVFALLLCAVARAVLVASVPELADLALDGRVIAFTLAIAAAAGLACGLGPALACTRNDLVARLKNSASLHSSGHGSRLRSSLVIAQMAIAAVMLGSTGLLIRCVFNTRQADPGFPAANLAAAQIFLPDAAYGSPDRRAALYRQAIERLGALPGVQGAAATSSMPMASGPEYLRVEVEGRDGRPEGDYMSALYTRTSAGFLELLRIPVLRGRALNAGDRQGGPRVTVINDALRRALWRAGEDCLGRRIKVGGAEWLTIVGVAADTRQDLLAPAFPEAFVPDVQDPPASAWIVLRTPLPAGSLAGPVRAAVAQLDPDLPFPELTSLDDIKALYLPWVLIAGLGIFAGASLLLAGIGLYGIVSFLVARRTREMGIRIALGADGRDIARLVLWQGVRVAAVGCVFGVAGALAAGRLLSVSLWGVKAADPLALAGVSAVLFSIAVAAVLVPARRAMRVDPAVALRSE